MTAATYSLKGTKLKETALPATLFEAKVKPAVLAQAVRVYLSNLRKAPAKTKTRGEVEGSTRKIFRQKGTGRARHGSVRAPIFVGGGIAHGPSGQQHYRLELSRPLKRLALTGALSAKKVDILSGALEATGKTKQIAQLVKKLYLNAKVLLVNSSKEEKLSLAARNVEGLTRATAEGLNAYIILKHKNVLFTKQALEELEKIYVS